MVRRPVAVIETYVFNRRLYQLAADENGWQIATGHPGETPVHRHFTGEGPAGAAGSRMLAATIAIDPRPLRAAQINNTMLVLAADDDGRAHLGELAGPDGDSATAFTDRAAAVSAWRHRCCELARAADLSGAASTDDHEPELR